jgi:Anti-sigma factor NepR
MSKAKPIDDRVPPDPGLDAKAIEAIGRALKAHYDDLVKAPLPDRFHELIAKLDAADETAPEGSANAAG